MKNLDFDWQINEFMIYCRSTQLRERTMYSYEQTLRLFERWCADEYKIYSVDKVTENLIRKYINDLQERGKYTFYVNDLSKKKNYPDRRRDYRKPVSVTTINNYIRNIRVFFNWLEKDYVIRKNPMRKIRQLKYNRQAKVFLTDEDLRKLISKFDKSYFTEHRDYVMILLMLDSGMRLGECSTLLLTDVELARRRINLRAEETKGRKDRTVYFSSKTEVALRRWIQFKDRYVESDYLFPVKDHGGHINVHNFETNFKRYINRAGLNEDYCPHCLRNNFAKRCLMNGMDIFTLSKILGHSSVEVTESLLLELIYTICNDSGIKTGQSKTAGSGFLIERALNYIKSHLTEDLRLEIVADAMSLSPIHFHNTFKAAVGMTLRDYVEEQRIKKATNLLLSTNDSLTEIAYECGFSSQSYFSFVFKRKMHVTPREYVQAIYNKYEL